MGIANRDYDISEQRFVESITIPSADAVTGTKELYTAPCDVTLEAVNLVPVGISGTPTIALQTNRFVVGSGVTAIPVIGATTYVAFSTSGLVEMPMPTSGSTLLSLVAGDVLELVIGSANSAWETIQVSVQGKYTQDIKSMF